MTLESISVTEAGSALDCRRYWYWSNYLRNTGLESNAPAIPLWLGRGIHKGLEGYFRGNRDLLEGINSYVTWYNNFCTKIQRDFAYIWVDLQKELKASYSLGWDMIENFSDFERTGNSKLVGKILEVEKRYKHPILDTNRSPTNVILSGKVDLILEHEGAIYLVDHKSHTSAKKPDFSALSIDDQVTGYAYLYWRETGIIPTGIIYNVLMKATPRPPEVLQSGKLSKSKSQFTTWYLYKDAIKTLGLKESDYLEILNYYALSGYDDYFVQEETFRNEEELLAYENRTYWRMKEMREILEDPTRRTYSTPSTRGCSWCSFKEACKSQDDGGDPESLFDTLFSPRIYEE